MFCAASPAVAVRSRFLRFSPSFPPKHSIPTSAVIPALSSVSPRLSSVTPAFQTVIPASPSVIPAKAGIHPTSILEASKMPRPIPRVAAFGVGLPGGCEQ